jgi:hypothetical protein
MGILDRILGRTETRAAGASLGASFALSETTNGQRVNARGLFIEQVPTTEI